MRKYKRHMALVRMQKAGLRRICRHGKGQKSFFSSNWREWLESTRTKIA